MEYDGNKMIFVKPNGSDHHAYKIYNSYRANDDLNLWGLNKKAPCLSTVIIGHERQKLDDEELAH